MPQEKSICITYLLWLLFGWFGLHHFYLGRDGQAFAWWSTFGGVFLLGWIRDLWRIPGYVEDANEDPSFIEELTYKMKTRKYPKFRIVRFAGQLMVGYFYGILVKLALPEETPYALACLLVSAGIGYGTYLIGNIGREQGKFWLPCCSSFVCHVSLTYWNGEEANYMVCALAAACTFNYFRQFRRTYNKKSFCNRVITMLVCMFVIFTLWTSFLYFNAEITTEDGEKVKIRDSVNHFFKSPAWLEFKQTLYELYSEGKKHGWKNFYDEFIKALDPKGEANARRVLDVTETATNEEIKKVYKKLVRKWHPDKHKNNKEEAQAKFMEIQEAYDILTSKKTSNTRTESERTEF